MKNRDTRRLQDIDERNGVSPLFGNMREGCFFSAKHFEGSGRNGDPCDSVKTVRPLADASVAPSR